jgi:hypothetical protein
MGNLHIQQKRNKENNKTLHRCKHKNCIPNKIHNTKYIKAPYTDKYEKSGVYQMQCTSCPLKYIGQMGRSFNIRYREHLQDIKNINGNSVYSNHILNTDHSKGSITDIMKAIKAPKRQNIYIYKGSKEELHVKDAHNRGS